MKKVISLCLVLFLLVCAITSCAVDNTHETTSQATSQTTSQTTGVSSSKEYTPIFTKENMPKIDGSTACIPLASLVMQRTLGLSAEEANEEISFSTTDYAYYALNEGKSDILFVYEGLVPDGIKDTLDFYPIGMDALVFLTNSDNKTANLSLADIKDIYSGKKTSWKDFGGSDSTIAAYQRNPESGSGVMMEKLVMQGTALAECPKEYSFGEMGTLVEAIAQYKNEGGALGYSVYYYIKNMYIIEGIKMISIGGIAPTNETIAAKSYPLTNEFFAVVRKSDGENSPSRQMLNWILSEKGVETIKDAGYVAIQK